MGAELGSSSRARRSYAFGDSDDSSEHTESEVEGIDALQIALRDKEEALVQSALARIRRAQEKGKREVKLNQDELDALENRRKRMQAAATTKARKESGSSGASEREKRRRSDRISIPIAAAAESITRPSSRPSSRRDKTRSRRSDEAPHPPHPPAASNPPGMLVAGPDGLAYAPLGTYPPNNALQNSQPPSRNSPSRPRSATTQQLRSQPPPIPYFSHQQAPHSRHFSDSMRPASSSSNGSRRPLPDEADWHPTNSRRSSAASSHSQGFMVDPFDYQVSSDAPPPIPSQYQQQGGRRNFSNPSDITYSSIRRTPPGYPQSQNPNLSSRPLASSSDPSLRHGSSRGPGAYDTSDEEDEDESDDLGNGVQVFVEEERERDREVERERERESQREKERTVAKRPAAAGRKKGKGR